MATLISVISRLATTLGRRDEVPNQELAWQICLDKDKKSIDELLVLLKHKDKNIRHDCIKVLYEIGEREPGLISHFYQVFLELLSDKNNRMIWGAMHALDCIASVAPKEIYENLTTILNAADKGSVITKDHLVAILIKLAKDKRYSDNALSLLLEQLKSSATNQLPMYAEKAVPTVNSKVSRDFIKVLSSRLEDIDKESKRLRLEKVIRKLSKLNQ